jgi:hypothetical protein
MNQPLAAVQLVVKLESIHVVTPSGGGGNVLALLIMREQKASPMLGPFGNNGPGGNELSYYQSIR